MVAFAANDGPSSYRTLDVALDDRVVTVTLDRPECLNAVSPLLLRELADALWRESTRADTAAMIIRGAGTSFCAGFDLRVDQSSPDEMALVDKVEQLHDITRAIRRARFPVVASVRGYALGAGAELALCSDLVVASDTAQFGFPEVDVSLSVTGGISTLLPLAVGAVKAKELVLLGDRLGAAEARDLGLVNWVVPDDELERHTRDIVGRLVAKPRFAIAAAKATLDAAAPGDLEAAFAVETGYAVSTQSSAAAENARTRFQDTGEVR